MQTPEKSREETVAKVTRLPEYQSAATIYAFDEDNTDLHSTIKELQEQISDIHNGSMKRPESLLAAQAHTLDMLFNNLAQRSRANMNAGYGEAAERYMRLALKAQNQCRTTIEALSAIKNPPVIFAKQANISNGPQQVNNGSAAPTHTGTTINQQDELSGQEDELLTDSRASQDALRINPEVETLGKIHRAKNRGR